jgi:hypothetical protein
LNIAEPLNPVIQIFGTLNPDADCLVAPNTPTPVANIDTDVLMGVVMLVNTDVPAFRKHIPTTLLAWQRDVIPLVERVVLMVVSAKAIEAASNTKPNTRISFKLSPYNAMETELKSVILL